MLLTVRKQQYFEASESLFHISLLGITFFVKKESGFISISVYKNKIIELAYINLNKTKNTYWTDVKDEYFRISFNS